MNSHTARKPDSKRSARSNKSNKYVKQTARFDARRDGKPIIFGWGGLLSHKEMIKFQQRATWAVAGLIGLLIVAVIVGTWINLNVITPGLPITSVNGHQIPQSDYRKLVAVRTEREEEKLNGPHGLNAQASSLKAQVDAEQKIIDTDTSKIDTLNKEIKSASSNTQRQQLNAQLASTKKDLTAAQTKHDQINSQYTNLEQNTIPDEQQLFTQSQVGNDSATYLQDDEIIREWLATQSAAVQAKVNPTATQVNQFIANLKANLPKGMTYSKFLSQDNISDSDVQTMSALLVRRNNMQSYLASLIKSPTYQVHVLSITASTQSAAQQLLNQLKKGADFGTLAKQKSVDATTASSGGDLGWLARGQLAQTDQSGVIDNWLFDPARYVGELSPVLDENGAYHIVKIVDIDPSRALDKTTLQSLQTNALTSWLFEQRALPNMKITAVNQNMLTDTSNMPPDLPSGAPATAVPGAPNPAAP